VDSELALLHAKASEELQTSVMDAADRAARQGRLAPRQRQLVLLYCGAQLGCRDIAECLGATEAQVESDLQRAFACLFPSSAGRAAASAKRERDRCGRTSRRPSSVSALRLVVSGPA